MKAITLNLRKCNIDGDLCMISIRDHKNGDINKLRFNSDSEAIEKYNELNLFYANPEQKETDFKGLKNFIPKNNVLNASSEETDPTEQEPPPKKDNQDSAIIEYVKSNFDKKGVKSARHLNKNSVLN